MSDHEHEDLRGLVLEIQRMSTEDGPGIRSTVFFKGCTLACEWCHNPESISPKPQLQWIGSRCIGCGLCMQTCTANALSRTAHAISIDRTLCTGCGECARQCPGTALELMGAWWTPQALANELAKDRSYFETSGGGVTLSGGEVAMQPEFAEALLRELRAQGINTAIDTCGNIRTEALERLLPLADLVLFDIKLMDPSRHREATGKDNKRILANFAAVCEQIAAHPATQKLWVRTPIIPDATDDEENIRSIGAFLATFEAGSISRWELCAFNNLCKDKYLRLGTRWKYADCALMERTHMERLTEIARASGVDPAVVHFSGSVRSGGDTAETAAPRND